MLRLLTAALLVAALPAMAQQSETVTFTAGSDDAVVKASVKGTAYRDYVLGAEAGQTMAVALAPKGNAIAYFNIFAPGSDTALYDSAASGNEARRHRAAGERRLHGARLPGGQGGGDQQDRALHPVADHHVADGESRPAAPRHREPLDLLLHARGRDPRGDELLGTGRARRGPRPRRRVGLRQVDGRARR